MRSLVLLPWVLPGVVAAILWRFMYDPQLGLINSFLIRIGLAERGVAWLAEPSTAMGAAIVAAVWKGFPFSTIVYLAALQNVDREQIEAATIDGAGAVSAGCSTWCIPAMREVIVINIVLTTILTFNYFDMIWVLTRGGPQNATHIFPTKIYELGFGQFRFGEAAAYGVFSILVLAVLIALYFARPERGGAEAARHERSPGSLGAGSGSARSDPAGAGHPAAVLLDGVGVAEARRPSPSPSRRRLWPENPTLENYVTAFRPEFRVYFMNSMIVSLSTVLITVSLALLIFVSGVEAWFPVGRDGKPASDAPDLGLLLEYLKDPAPDTTIFLFAHEQLAVSALTKAVEKAGVVLVFALPERRELNSVARQAGRRPRAALRRGRARAAARDLRRRRARDRGRDGQARALRRRRAGDRRGRRARLRLRGRGGAPVGAHRPPRRR